jgi:hypothetical protein
MVPPNRESADGPSGFVCSTCGEWHSGLPLDWSFTAPIYWEQIPEDERSNRGFLNTDICVIDKQDFFVRGLIPIPVIESEEIFMWGVWVTLSEPNFDRIISLWNDPRIIEEPPYFGWLANNIPIYPNTLNMKTHISSRNVKDRPLIELEPNDHPLPREQRTGISRKRVEEIAALMMHREL